MEEAVGLLDRLHREAQDSGRDVPHPQAALQATIWVGSVNVEHLAALLDLEESAMCVAGTHALLASDIMPHFA